MVFKLYRRRGDPRLHIVFRHRGYRRFHCGGSYPAGMSEWDVVAKLLARKNAEPHDEIFDVYGRRLWPPVGRC
jgi:hypothetical protein